MELNLKGADIQCWREVFSQTVRREAAQEAIVPDTMPDVGGILSTAGTVLIRGKDVGEGRVRIEANLPVKIVCTGAEGEGVFLQEMDIPLFLSVEDPAIPEAAPCVAELSLAVLEVKAPNPRKLSVRAEVACRLRCFSQGQLNFPAAPEREAEDVHVREREMELTKIAAVTEKTFILTDEFNFPQDHPPAASISESQLLLETLDSKAVGNKLVVKGTARSRLVYLTGEGEPVPMEVRTEFSQILEADAMPETPLAEVTVIPSGVYYEIGGDGRTGNLELHLVAQAVILENARVSCAVDAYSNTCTLELTEERVEFRRVLRPLSLRETVTERFSLPQPADAVTVVSLQPGLPAADGAGLRLPLTVSACYRTAEGELRTLRTAAFARFGGDLTTERELEPTGVALQELSLTPSGSGLELRAVVELQGLLWEKEEISCVSALHWDPEKNPDPSVWPSLVLLRACSGDDLWELAKENHSTMEAIRDANHLEGEEGAWEKLLLIPKCL